MTVIQPNNASSSSSPPPSSTSSSTQPASGPAPGPAPVAPSPPLETGSSPSSVSSPTPPTEKTNPSAPCTPEDDGPRPPSPSPRDLLEAFPLAKLTKLEELISNPRWVIPVLPKAELEVLLETSIALARANLDNESEPCQRFFRDGLVTSFTKIMTDEAVSSWRLDIHKCILKNCERLIELCVLKLDDDKFPLLDLLSMVLNPGNKFHLYNAPRQSEETFTSEVAERQRHQPFARTVDPRQPRGWLVDLLNRFGHFGGFERLLARFKGTDPPLTVPLMHVLVKPFGQCHELLTANTVSTFLLPIVESVPKYLESLSEDELKKETKSESKNDALSTIIKSLKNIASAMTGQEENIRHLEMFRLKMILRQLQVSSFGGKMNALNEVNRVISSVSYFPQRHQPTSVVDEEEFLTAERMANWLKENKVLQITLQDSLHQPQYVEKLEKVIRFIIKEKTLSLGDLDDIWASQVGQHEAIVKNVHDLLAKLAWDFSPEQLDHLFDCFQNSWNTAPPKQREKLLELIRRLAEDDKDGVMAEKVLTLFWSLAHNPDTSTELLDQALAAHVKILDYSCAQYRESQKTRWLEKCIDELKGNRKWVLPALKQIREICCLYHENPSNASTHAQRTPATHFRHEVINKLQSNHALVILVADNLTGYIDEVRKSPKSVLESDPNDFLPDGRFNHIAQVQERLSFLRFLLKDGQLWLCAPQAKQIWNCLAENAVFPQDREACFKWFSKLMGEEPDLDPEINKDFFENNILQLDPSLITESGIRCFDRFFKAVNSKDNKLIPKRRGYLMDDLELTGLDYIWRLVLCSPDEIAGRAIELLKDTFTNLGPRLQSNQVDIHEDFISSCMDRLKAAYDTITVIEQDRESNKLYQELTRLCRVLKVLHEYVMECDADFSEERTFIPLYRAFRGKQICLTVRFSSQGRAADDIEIWTHTNDTMGSVRRQIVQRLKINTTNVKVELFLSGDVIDSIDDRKILSALPIKDKTLLTGKLSPIGGNLVSSPDSSSDSSTSSPRHHFDGPNVEVERCLPGVIMSNQKNYCQFLLQLADLGSTIKHAPLQESARALLNLIPGDKQTVDKLKNTCTENATSKKSASQIWDGLFFSSSPSQTLYNLQICYCLLMPGSSGTGMDKTFDFQLAFVRAKGIPAVISMLTKNNFLANADMATKRTAYLVLFKICKFLFSVAGYSLVHMVAEACQPDSTTSVSPTVHNQAVVLQQAMHHIPHPNQELIIRNFAQRLAPSLLDVGAAHLPDLATITAIIRLAWASAGGNLGLVTGSVEDLHARLKEAHVPETEDVALCREALEVLTLAIALYPTSLDNLCKDKSWHNFIIGLVLLSKVKGIRGTAADQFLLIATRCPGEHNPLRFFNTLLFTVLNASANDNADQCTEYFLLLSRLLNYTSATNISLNAAETLLNNEIIWLKKVKENVRKNNTIGCHEHLLEGHLLIAKELLAFMSSDKKFEIGSSPQSSINLVRDLLDDFLFPSSRMNVIFRDTGEIPMSQSLAVCSSSSTVTAAFDLLVGLCTGCVPNLKLVASILLEMFFTDKDDAVVEWEFLPPVGPRPTNGFVGLKNAGATCYMNSVLQQLFMIEGIRDGVLSAEGACNDPEEDFSGTDRDDDLSDVADDEQNRREYNITILKQVQAIFAHLARTKLQFYVPRGLWKHFRMMQGEPVNLREQQDAVEFFMRLIDLADEALKALGYEQKMTKILGGIFSDQKICRTCPHRYSREQPFSVISVDVKNYSNLTDSLHEYVKGELLDGSNAYYCERCDKKVDTIKRLCVKKLPPILVIQLKRFDYDYERECAIKFNDYFEFPRELDMEPYTVAGLAKIEGEAIDCEPSDLEGKVVRNYNLRGMVVHSGQASGGHYYSYIQCRGSDGEAHWFKFDDGDVTEIKMEDEEELRAQCYGGEYMSEVFDPMVKRMSYRKQKRWWNAYMLFYTRADVQDESVVLTEMARLALSKAEDSNKQQQTPPKTKIPLPIDKSIQKQNINFLHLRNQFSTEFFHFMRKLMSCNAPYVTLSAGNERLSQEGEELAMVTVHLASKFLFSTGFRTKKSLRGSAQEWYELLTQHLRYSPQVRLWFCQKVLFAHPARFCEYILECPSAEVRTAFVRILVFVAHFSLNDGPCPVPALLQQPGQPFEPVGTTLSDHLLQTVLALLWMEVSEHGRHLPQYFSLFVMYASLGVAEKSQLLKLNVPATFIQVALDEGPGPPIKYQYAELAKLYQVVSQLVRCCDVSSRCQSAVEGKEIMTNPYADQSCVASTNQSLMPLQPQVSELVFQRYGYLKKLIEDANTQEDTKKLLQFCAWENPSFSHAVLHELLWQIAIAYTHELRPYLDLLYHILSMEDSWQTLRIQKSLRGIPDDHSAREGIFDTIQRSKTHYQKRAYQCIKLLVTLFSQCNAAKQLLATNGEIKRKWTWSVEWLSEELERGRPGGVSGGGYNAGSGGQYSYNNWSPPAQSNESVNGYFLERSHSARITLEKACELLPDEDLEGDDVSGDPASSASPVPSSESNRVPAGEEKTERNTLRADEQSKDHDSE